jgi:hypothetical protein
MILSPLVPFPNAAQQYPNMFLIRHESTAVGGIVARIRIEGKLFIWRLIA